MMVGKAHPTYYWRPKRNMEFILPEEIKNVPVTEDKVYELIIVGAGPAGMTAAVYASRKRLDTLVLSRDVGGQVVLTTEIENYMGYQYITGQELTQKFEEQIRQFPIAIDIGEEASKLSLENGLFMVATSGDKKFRGKTIIVATGKRSRPLNVPGEKELVGRGVSYCATCDAPLFREMDVAVIGGGNSALTAVSDLIKISRKIYLVNIFDSLQADSVLIEKAKASAKVKFLLGYEVKELRGENSVAEITVISRQTKEEKILKLRGVFIEIGLIPNTDFVTGVVTLNQGQEIVVDCKCRTNIPGIFAAGDVTAVPEKQIIVAAGEGAKASLSAYRYLLEK